MMQRLFTYQLSAIDPALGRLDYESLSDQALMEIIIGGMAAEDKKRYQDENGNFKDVCEWNLRACADDRVTGIFFMQVKMGDGQFPFDFIPPLVCRIWMTNSAACGTLDTSLLPLGLNEFVVNKNKLHGKLNFKAFPRALKYIQIKGNAFCGSCALGELPDCLMILIAGGNKFSGSISLNDLPPAMQKLCLKKNMLTGQINIERLPRNMYTLDLSGNQFSGNVRLTDHPHGFEEFNIENNSLSGSLVLFVDRRPILPFDFICSSVTAIFDMHGNKHPYEEALIEMIEGK